MNRRRLLLLSLAVLLGLASTTEERLIGTSTDEDQMLETSVALAEFGEVGLPRGGPTLIDRSGGDAVSPFGLALPLLEAIPSSLARPLEHRLGVGASQTLYAAVQILLIGLAALLAGALASVMGASETGQVIAVLGTAFGSPLWAYEAAAYSEPLQAAAVTGAVLLAYGSSSRRSAMGAGACAALALLAKTPNILVVPLLLLPAVIAPGKTVPSRRWAWMALGALPPAAGWLTLEIVRFGRPLGSYGGHAFSFPWIEGFWRLLVGPNKGFLLYFPLGFLGLLWLIRNVRRRAALAVLLFFLALLALYSAWWAWDGTVGWGPRFLVPAVPLIAAGAGAAVASRRTAIAAAWLVVAGALLNVLGVLVPESATTSYLSACKRVKLSSEEASSLPAYYVSRTDEGLYTSLNLVAARDAALSPLRLHVFFLCSRLGASAEEVDRRLSSPPWAETRPGAVPSDRRAPAFLREPFSWPFLGRSLFSWGRAGGRAAWYQGVVAQVYRAIDIGAPGRATSLSRDLDFLQPSGFSAALLAESLRVSGQVDELVRFRATLPAPRRDTLAMGIVMALVARDRGDERVARETLRTVASVSPRPGIRRALDSPLSEWPKTMRELIWEELPGRAVGLPHVGS